MAYAFLSFGQFHRERSQIGDELVGLFQGGEVSAIVDVGPPCDRVRGFGESADRWVFGESDNGGRNA
jgi:hypothetical protein